jgi:hypothetical protein
MMHGSMNIKFKLKYWGNTEYNSKTEAGFLFDKAHSTYDVLRLEIKGTPCMEACLKSIPPSFSGKVDVAGNYPL